MAASAEEGIVKFVTLGDRGSFLSSSSVYAVATGQAHICINSSALISDLEYPSMSLKPSEDVLLFPMAASSLESRASLTSLINNLLLSNSNSTKIRAFIANIIKTCLNSNSCPETYTLGPIDVTEEENLLIQKSYATVYGICAILDHESTSLISVVDAVAAISCEAAKMNVERFSSMDTGDGFIDKERLGVAGDMKVLLKGSKLVGKLESETVSLIPNINGRLRGAVKSMHSMTHVVLNSRELVNEGDIVPVVLALAEAILEFGKSSLFRAKMNLDSVGIESLKTSLFGMFENKCPNEKALMNAYKLVFCSRLEDDTHKLLRQVSSLLGIVWRIVSWEAITAYVALQGRELISAKGVEVSTIDEKVAKRSEKKKKNSSVVLGKGTSVVVQLIKDRLQNKIGASSDVLQVLEQLVGDLLLFFDPKQPKFDEMVRKVKEIVGSNEYRRLPKIPKGTRDFANEQMTMRKRVLSVISEVFERHGATALDTPVFELREILMGKYGADSKLVYDLADQGGELCSLRYDLTVPFARYVAMNGITSFKRYQISKVYRRDNPSKGRFREFYQCDFDIAGEYGNMEPDTEIVIILTELLDELDIGDYEIKLNHRKLLDAMLEICGVPPEKFRTICSSIDKLDKQSFEQVKKEMVEEKGLSVETADNIGTFVKERGQPKELLSKLKLEGNKFLENESSKRALDELEILFDVLEYTECIGRVVFDLSLARGLDYYTGVIFEAVFKGTTQVGSIAAGGRYDNLIGMFGTKQVPAVGVSLGIERVFAIMEQQQKDQNQTIRPNETQVLVSILGDDSKLRLAMKLSRELWKEKIKAEYMMSTRFRKHMDRAKESGIPWMVLVGDKELESGIVKVKNLETDVEEEVPRSNFVAELKKKLSI